MQAQSTQQPKPQAAAAAPGSAAIADEPAYVIFGLDDKRRPHASWFAAEDADKAEVAADLMDMAIWPVEPNQRDLARQTQRAKVFSSGKCFCPFVNAKLYAALEAAAGAAEPFDAASAAQTSEGDPLAPETATGEGRGGPAHAANGAAEAAGGPKALRTAAPSQKPSTGAGGPQIGRGDKAGERAATGLDEGDRRPADGRGLTWGGDEALLKAPTLPRDWSEIGPGSLVLASTGFVGDNWYEAVCVAALDDGVFELAWSHYPHEPNAYRRIEQLGLLPALASLDGPNP